MRGTGTAICLIQGASRGIGAQYCRSLLARKNVQVIATCRKPEDAQELLHLKHHYPKNLHVLQLDVTKEETIAKGASEVEKQFGKLDLLVNAAAILHPSGKGETSLKTTTMQGLEQTFQTNTIGPLMVAKHFSKLLVKGEGLIGNQSHSSLPRHSSVLVNMSAKVGSITDNALGGWYSYRMSKAALNMATKNLSIEFGRSQQKVICISLHPGTVDTDLSRPYHKNVKTLFTPEHSVASIGINYHVLQFISMNVTVSIGITLTA
ncbi:C-factor-like [Plakobranchus ocellatus]|uniref:C-factor-like n=1 Tax=Plakobranchus ocellatus TaxID=259542 RepID=A0AAV4BX09_9GAST|nr:C-factor-like [Plakobranchus ocellatus]